VTYVLYSKAASGYRATNKALLFIIKKSFTLLMFQSVNFSLTVEWFAPLLFEREGTCF
jgi:hypothetical protein